jgi:hypothetical protein
MADATPIPVQWEPLNGAEVLRVYQADPDGYYPQIALLRVSTDTYSKFAQDPSTLFNFVNQNSIFPASVNSVGPSVSLWGVPGETPIGHVLVLVHGRNSAMVVSGLPLLPQGDFLNLGQN